MILCSIFRSERQEGAYLYTPFKTDSNALAEVPGELLAQLGTLTEVMKLKLTPDRKLAQANTTRVIQQLEEKGYYLQLPPSQHLRAGEDNTL